MFDLFRSRDKLVRYMLGALLVVVALSMLLYLIPGSGTSSLGGEDRQVVADIGGEKLTTREVVAQLNNLTRRQQIPADLMQVYLPQLVDQMIADRAMAYEANRLGLEITDEQLAKTLRSFPQFASLTPEQYRMTVEQQLNMSVPEFESNLRKNQYLVTLRNIALAGVVVTPQEVEQEYRRRGEKLKLAYVSFNPDKFRGEVNATPTDLQEYYSKNASQFQVPESRDLQVIVVDRDKLAASIQLPEAQVRAYYDSHKDEFRTPDRVRVRHILLRTDPKNATGNDKIKAKAEDLLKQIRNGADFAELAKKNSEDPGSAKNGGELGWVARGQTVKNFENAAFSLPKGQTSGVISTEYGYHILQVEDKEVAQLQPFEKVSEQIAGNLRKQQINDRVQNLAEQVRAALAKKPADGQAIAAQFGVDFINAPGLKPGQPLPQLGANPELDSQVITLKKGEVTPVVAAGPSRLVVASVANISPAHPQPFNEVEAQVRERVTADKAGKIAQQKAAEAAGELKTNGGDLNAIAKKYGLEVKTSEPFNRNGAIEGVGSATYFGDAFSKPVGTAFGPVSTGNATVLAKVVDRVEPDMSQLAAQKSAMIQEIKSRRGDERAALFQDSVLSKLIAEGKVKVHRDAINSLLSRYRS